MNKRANNILDIIMFGAVGFFLASVVHRFLYRNMAPYVFASRWTPWYLSIELRAIIFVFILVICLVIKAIINRNK